MEISPQLREEASTAVTTALMQLIRQPNISFDSSILMNMPREFRVEEELSMKVEGTNLVINPEWYLSINKNDQQWNLRHLAWHVHGFDELRVGDKDAKRWNMACDLWINGMLTDDTSFNVNRPQDAVYDSRFKGMEKEEIYKYLEDNQQEEQKQEQKQDPMGGDCGQGEPDQDGDQEGDGQGQSEGQQQQRQQLEQEISNMVQQAAMQAKQAGGKVPNTVEEYLEELYNPKLPWNKLLARYMTAHNTYDYSYKRINKKFFAHGFLMPSMYSEGLGPVYIATDESCSVSDKDLELYLGAIKAIKDEMNPESMTVMGFTTQVDHTHVINQDEDIDKIKFRVHGGTHIPAVFDYIKEHNHKPQVLIVFSDMESAFPQQKPDYDVIWICVGNPRWTPPFGRVVYVES